jgi:hypothetical protein
MTAESTAVCDQQPQPPRAQLALSGAQRLRRATDRRPLPAGKLVDGYAQFAQTCRASASGIEDACGPGSPDSHRVVWGLTSRLPVSLAGFPPVSRLPAGFSPFARIPLVSLRPAFSGSSPSAVARVPFPFGVPPGSLPLSNLHDSAAEGRFRRRWSRAARAKVTSPAATTPRLDLAVIRPALQMGNGWARCDVATESPVTSGREHRTPPRLNRPDRRLLARRMSAPPPPSVTASGEVVGSDFGRHGEHPGASMSVAWMPIGRACQQLAFTVSDVRRSQRTTRNTSIKSRDTQDPVPILVTGLVR